MFACHNVRHGENEYSQRLGRFCDSRLRALLLTVFSARTVHMRIGLCVLQAFPAPSVEFYNFMPQSATPLGMQEYITVSIWKNNTGSHIRKLLHL